MLSFEVTGTRELAAALKALANAAPSAAAAELYLEAELVMGDSKENFVPVDQGALRASGFVEQPEINGDEISVRLGYGGPSVDYALVQHESAHLRHTVGESHYLLKPLTAAVQGMAGRMAMGLWDRLRRAIR